MLKRAGILLSLSCIIASEGAVACWVTSPPTKRETMEIADRALAEGQTVVTGRFKTGLPDSGSYVFEPSKIWSGTRQKEYRLVFLTSCDRTIYGSGPSKTYTLHLIKRNDVFTTPSIELRDFYEHYLLRNLKRRSKRSDYGRP